MKYMWSMEKVKVVYAVYVEYGKGKRSFLNLYTLHVVRMFPNTYCLYHVTPQLSLPTIWELQRWLSVSNSGNWVSEWEWHTQCEKDNDLCTNCNHFKRTVQLPKVIIYESTSWVYHPTSPLCKPWAAHVQFHCYMVPLVIQNFAVLSFGIIFL